MIDFFFFQNKINTVYRVHENFLKNTLWEGNIACCENCKQSFGRRVGTSDVVSVFRCKTIAVVPNHRVVTLEYIHGDNHNVMQTRFNTMQIMHIKKIDPNERIDIIETDALSNIELSRKIFFMFLFSLLCFFLFKNIFILIFNN